MSGADAFEAVGLLLVLGALVVVGARVVDALKARITRLVG